MHTHDHFQDLLNKVELGTCDPNANSNIKFASFVRMVRPGYKPV